VGALEDYSAVIEQADAGWPEVPRSLNNRGLLLESRGDPIGAEADYSAAIDAPKPPDEALINALVNRGRLRAANGNHLGAMADCTRAIEITSATPDQRARALLVRAVAHENVGNFDMASKDLEELTALPEVSNAILTRANELLGRCRDDEYR
jgi:tetratricopeptide (TPR) repeat protein